MNVRYQIFVSSTYNDLKAERKHVIDDLNKVGFIAIGMENFPASDEDQMEYIRPLIDESDYYVIIVKAKYGSKASDGKSYTEKEFDYAVASGKPVLAFLYDDVGGLRASELESDADSFAKLAKFKEKLTEKRLVRFWGNLQDLSSGIKDSLYDFVRRKPGLGWIRGDNAADPKVYVQLSELKQENEQLRQQLVASSPEISFPDNIRHGDDVIIFEFFVIDYEQKEEEKVEVRTGPFDYETTWDRLLTNLLDALYRESSEHSIYEIIEKRARMSSRLAKQQKISFGRDPARTVRFQFEALGLIETFTKYTEVSGFGSGLTILGRQSREYAYVHWRLSELGKRYVSLLNALKK